MHADCSRMFMNAYWMFQNICRMFQKPECMQIHEITHPWACMQLFKLTYSYISLHAGPWACMQSPELTIRLAQSSNPPSVTQRQADRGQRGREKGTDWFTFHFSTKLSQTVHKSVNLTLIKRRRGSTKSCKGFNVLTYIVLKAQFWANNPLWGMAHLMFL